MYRVYCCTIRDANNATDQHPNCVADCAADRVSDQLADQLADPV